MAETRKGQIKPNNQPKPGPIANTQGLIVPETSPNFSGSNNSAPTPVPETPKEEGWWKHWGSDVTHGVLDVVGLVPVLGEVANGAGALIYLAEGDPVSAAFDAAAMWPAGGQAATVGKYGAKAATKLAKEAAEAAEKKLAKEAAEAAEKKAAKEAEERAAKKADEGGNVKGKKKLKCGEYGKYGDLKKKTGDNKFDRDHIPSKEALKQRAAELKGDRLTPKEAAAIDKAGEAIAIPKQAHVDVSPTYGQSKQAAAKDAKNLAESARRDVEAMLTEIEQYDADGNCKKAYQKAASKIMRMSNKDFDKMLADTLRNIKK